MMTMRVEGKLQLEDLKRMMADASKRNSPKDMGRGINLNARPLASLAVLFGLDISLMLLYGWLQRNEGGNLLSVLTLLMLGLFSVLTLVMIAAVWFTWATPRTLAKQPGVLGLRSYTLEDEGLRVTTELSDGLTKWKAITEVRSDSDYLFIYMGKIMGPIVPRRFFDSDDHFHDFVDEMNRRVDEVSDEDPVAADLPKAVATIKDDDH